MISVNRRRKGIKVTLMSFSLYAGRFTVECTEYGITIFIFLHSHVRFTEFYFGFKDYRLFAASQRLAALLTNTPALLILVWLSFEKIGKKIFSSNPYFEPNPRCFRLFAFK